MFDKDALHTILYNYLDKKIIKIYLYYKGKELTHIYY
jgi:hypothetical protein